MLFNFYKTLYYFYNNNNINCNYFKYHENETQILIHLYNLYLIFKLWDLPHYRNKTYGDDINKNLYNLYIPNTFISMYYLSYNKYIALISILFIYPVYCFITNNEQLLLYPDNWFWIWRYNCNLVQLDYSKTSSKSYKNENKKIFLEKCDYFNIPVSPSIKYNIIVKNIEIEGGMGIHTFNKNKWIIQKILSNNKFLKDILPNNAPLSTLRIITYKTQHNKPSVLSGCLRPGMNNAITDHDSILFSININNGVLETGCINKEWYNKYYNNTHIIYNKHPQHTKKITGLTIPDFNKIKNICINAHSTLLDEIPIAGWDVALTNEYDICLLEVNLSCNLFCANYNKLDYHNFLKSYY